MTDFFLKKFARFCAVQSNSKMTGVIKHGKDCADEADFGSTGYDCPLCRIAEVPFGTFLCAIWQCPNESLFN
jgi:hypothetical protein